MIWLLGITAYILLLAFALAFNYGASSKADFHCEDNDATLQSGKILVVYEPD